MIYSESPCAVVPCSEVVVSQTMRPFPMRAVIVLAVPLAFAAFYLLASLRIQTGRSALPAPPENDTQFAAAAQLASPTPAPAQMNPTHIVQRGDTLSRLATQYGVTWMDIAAASQLTDVNNLFLGQILLIPLYGMTATAPGATGIFPPPLLMTSTPTLTASPAFTETLLVTATPEPTIAAAAPVDQPAFPPTDQPTDQPVTPTAGPSPTLPPLPTAVALAPIGRSEINGIPAGEFIIMDAETRAHVHEIFELGQQLGRNPRAFSKVGDSTIENPFFMDRFDEPGSYNLAEYNWLQPTIDWFSGSFSRQSLAVAVGLHTWSVMDPMWADPYQCLGGETMLECEVRVHNPAVIIFRLGVNDVGVPGYVENSMRAAIEYSLENGIIPIIGTKGDLRDGTINNDIMRRLAAEYHVPLWDYDVLAATIPGRGLVADGAHMTTFYAHDWSLPQAFQTGHGVHTLAGLMMLDAIYREILADRAFYVPEATEESTAEATAELTPESTAEAGAA